MNLQGNYGANLQGSTPYLQGSGYQLQGPPLPPASNPTANTAATSPAKSSYVNRVATTAAKKPLATYKYADDPTVYDATTNNPFSSAEQFLSAGGDWNTIETRQRAAAQAAPAPAPASPAPTQQPAPQPQAAPTPAVDPYSSYIDAAKKYIASLAPSAEVTEAKKKYADFLTSKEMGMNRISDKPIAMEFITGQKASLERTSGTEARRLQGDIGLAQDEQSQYQAQLEASMGLQKGIGDMESSRLKSAQEREDAALQFSIDNNITTPFFNQNGTIIRSSDLKKFSSEAEAWAAGAPKDLNSIPTIQKPLDLKSYPTSYQEYLLAQQDGFNGSYNDYQTMDANRKAIRSTTNYNVTAGGQQLNSSQSNLLNGIINKYNASPSIQGADRAKSLATTIQQIKANPNNAALQLNLVYQYIGALDNYNSAVREGELALVGSLQSKIGAIQNKVQGISNTQKPVDAKTALQIADAAQSLVSTINSAAQQKAQSFKSQANTFGLGQAWDEYIGGFNPSYGGGGASDPLGLGI